MLKIIFFIVAEKGMSEHAVRPTAKAVDSVTSMVTTTDRKPVVLPRVQKHQKVQGSVKRGVHV